MAVGKPGFTSALKFRLNALDSPKACFFFIFSHSFRVNNSINTLRADVASLLRSVGGWLRSYVVPKESSRACFPTKI